jgi:hypothetical protein
MQGEESWMGMPGKEDLEGWTDRSYCAPQTMHQRI